MSGPAACALREVLGEAGLAAIRSDPGLEQLLAVLETGGPRVAPGLKDAAALTHQGPWTLNRRLKRVVRLTYPALVRR
jgi:hypothetical protein